MTLSIKYPVTPTQMVTAEQRGWVKLSNGTWKPPKDFNQSDEARIEAAQRRRDERQRSAD